jgi:hypothetical protein
MLKRILQNHECPAKPPYEDQHLSDRDGEIYKTKLTRIIPYKLRQTTYGRFRDSHDRIRTWESNLSKYIVPETYHFHELVLFCAQ